MNKSFELGGFRTRGKKGNSLRIRFLDSRLCPINRQPREERRRQQQQSNQETPSDAAKETTSQCVASAPLSTLPKIESPPSQVLDMHNFPSLKEDEEDSHSNKTAASAIPIAPKLKTTAVTNIIITTKTTPESSFDCNDETSSASSCCWKDSSFPHTEGPLISIAPRVTARLRGAEETLRCVENDFYHFVSCVCCTACICCIMDASYVLCPHCKAVGPLLITSTLAHVHVNDSDGETGLQRRGVGLGFTLEDLGKWQEDILLHR